MTRYLSVGLALVFLAAPCQAQTAMALELVPDDSLGFLVIKNLRELSDKVDQTAKKLNVEERVSLLELIQKEMGIREGINDKGSAVFIVLKAKEDRPATGGENPQRECDRRGRSRAGLGAARGHRRQGAGR